MKQLLLWILRGYKKYISPHLGENCRFTPTCSEYAMEAIEIHGSIKGILLGAARFGRCNPFGKAGYDPPPKKGRWRSDEKQVWKPKKN